MPIAALAAAIAAAAAIALTPAAASAQQPEDADAAAPDASAAPDADTIATTLYPGWNTAAWLGPEAPVQAIFDAIPALELVEAWDAGEQRWLRARPGMVFTAGIERLTPGMGLWLRIGGGEPVTWTRPARADSVLLELRAGWNLVGWTGPDGEPAAEAFVRLGRVLGGASRYDAASGARMTYAHRPGSPANAPGELGHGDALWIRLTADARWWQPGAGPHPVAFIGDVPEDERARIRGQADDARAVFAERWGVEAAFAGYAGARETLAPRYLEVRGQPLPEAFCADAAGSVVFLLPDCAAEGAFARAYFRVLQDALSGGGGAQAPAWLAAGATDYAAAVAAGALPGGATAGQRLTRERRVRTAALPPDPPALSGLEAPAAFAEAGPAGRALAFLAADRLARLAGERSAIVFFEALAEPQAAWETAFEGAFGLTPAEFYADFGAHLAARLAPQGADGGAAYANCDRRVDTTTVSIEFLGAVPDADQARIRRQVDETRRVYAERWCVEAGFESYVGLDRASVLAKYIEVRGAAPPGSFCADYAARVVFARLGCVSGRTYPHEYFHVLQDALRGDAGQHVATWLVEGTASYAEVMQQGVISDPAAVHEHLERYRRSRAELLGRTTLPSLATFEDPARFYGHGASTPWGDLTYDLGFVAAHWLVGESVEVAIVDVFRALAEPSATWQEAFRSAFGMTVDDFYAAFGAYRTGLSGTITKPDGTYWVRGVVLKPDGSPLAAAWVGTDDGGGGDWEDTTHTGADGAFVLAAPDGNYTIRVDFAGTECPQSTTYTVNGADVTGISIRLPAGSPCA